MQTIRLKNIGEFGLISRLAKSVRIKPDILEGIGDDAAVLSPSGDKMVLLTTDMLMEGVHFTRNMGAKKIGYKAMACSVSDIAAMGGTPWCAVVSLGVPASLPVSFVRSLYAGMDVLAKKFHFSIVGGDTIASKQIVINVALLGTATDNQVLLRRGARVGDRIFVTGSLGRSLKTGRHLSFIPRVKEAQYIMKHFRATSMIDISDGLAGDLGHILEKSDMGAVIYEKLIPRAKGASLNEALYDGEDFELVFTLPPFFANKLLRTGARKFPFYYIGDIVSKEEGFMCLDKKGKRRPVLKRSFSHF